MMKSTVGRLFGFVASLGLLVLLASPAHADNGHEDFHQGPPSHSAPEIDPAGLGAIGSLLVGGSLLLKARRGKNPA
ncbi:MAG TPA: hypothetical protein VH374_08460 [Polyangia bacterium]|jgi:hypothetical protein|nr:hypothetical protein [Polyangia bacterium]